MKLGPGSIFTTTLSAGLYLALSRAFSTHFHNLAARNDLWFGADIGRHVWWTTSPYLDRYYWHPASFALFKVYGFILGAAGLPREGGELPLIALPGILLTAAAVAACATLLASLNPWRPGLQRFAVAGILLLVGPTLVFAPLPESHVLGGSALLLQAVLVYAILRDRARGKYSHAVHPFSLPALISALRAVGFTLANLLPAAILLFLWAGLQPERWRRRLLGFSAGVLCLVALPVLLHHLVHPLRWIGQFVRWAALELSWLVFPTLTSLGMSVQHLVLAQFGVPFTALLAWQDPFYGELVTSIVDVGPAPLSVAACLLWLAGIALWWRRAGPASPGRRITLFCAAALPALTGFHAIYATTHAVYAAQEAYIFSVHAWPYLVLPGVLVWQASLRKKDALPAVCITAAVALCAIQAVLGLLALLSLPGTLGPQVFRPAGCSFLFLFNLATIRWATPHLHGGYCWRIHIPPPILHFGLPK